jgi:hypothetical protein
VAWGTGKGITDALIGALRAHPNAGRLTLRFNQRVERLTQRAGRICGAAGVDETTGAPFEVAAEQVPLPPAASMAEISCAYGRTGTATGARRRPCS